MVDPSSNLAADPSRAQHPGGPLATNHVARPAPSAREMQAAPFPMPDRAQLPYGARAPPEHAPPVSAAAAGTRIPPLAAALSPGPTQQSVGRLAIPRLKREADDDSQSFKSSSRQRISHACEPCRQRKTRCSGERPRCHHCRDLEIKCYYTEGKRDREKKTMQEMVDKLSSYEALLRDLQGRSNSYDADRISRILEQADNRLSTLLRDPGYPLSETQEAESEPSGSVGSVEDVDHADEDFNKNDKTLATGYVGKSSDVSWLQRAKQQQTQSGDNAKEAQRRRGKSPTRSAAQPTLPDIDPAYSASSVSYHLDEEVVIMDDVDPYEIPPHEVALAFFQMYVDTVHDSFPIIGRDAFRRQLQSLLNMPHVSLATAGLDRWLAVLNMIFAISATYCRLTRADWDRTSNDHLIYFNRARKLAAAGKDYFSHPDLRQVQVYGLMAFHFISTDQINRAWMCMGNALRASAALGINLRNDSTEIADKAKEMRYRVWWSLYSLECHLSMLTGRQNSLVESVCTTPLPAPFDEADLDKENVRAYLTTETQKRERAPNVMHRFHSQASSPSDTNQAASPSAYLSRRFDLDFAKNITPNKGLHFAHYIQLNRLSQEVLTRIYTPEAAQRPWLEVQMLIQELEGKLLLWLGNLPPAFDFTRKPDPRFKKQALTLGLLYYGLQITIHRPCLCQFKEAMLTLSKKSREFNHDAALRCIQAARSMLDLLPAQINSRETCAQGPWWSLLHHIMQATSLLLLELSLRICHAPDQKIGILNSCQKAVLWLHAMAVDNTAARKAWSSSNNILRDLSDKDGYDVSKLPNELPGYKHVHSFPPMRLATGFSTTVPEPNQTQQFHSFHQAPMLAFDHNIFGNHIDPTMNNIDATLINPFLHYGPFNMDSMDLVSVDGNFGDMDNT